ncbi:MAG: helix-turn-helix domain-containing protein [Planctomycetota bacterium]
MEAVLRALNTPRRREILRLLRDGERSAGEVWRSFGDVTFGAVSQHLRILKRAGLVTVRAAGRQRLYRLDPAALGPLRPWLESMWDSALDRLKVLAELEEARRGPRAAATRRPQPRPRRSS